MSAIGPVSQIPKKVIVLALFGLVILVASGVLGTAARKTAAVVK